MNRVKTFLLACVAVMVTMPSMAQGVVVFKKDGTRVVYPYETIDSIVTYNYNENPPSGGSVNDGEDKIYTVNGVSFKMIAVKGGTFTMGATPEQVGGDPDELPTHEVTLSNYYIGETEVTQELWAAVMGENPENLPSSMLHPVEKVSWEDCQYFVSKINELTGETFHLPTEAQWEFAARGGIYGHGQLYSGGNTIDEVAWYAFNASGVPHPVKTKAPNELGIYDLSGNVWEWCSDWYGPYSSSSQVDPVGPASGSHRVVRGASWLNSDLSCRVAKRGHDDPVNRSPCGGFRLAQ